LLIAACDRVGEPLVDRLPEQSHEWPVVGCTMAPRCDARAPSEDTHPPVEVRPIDLLACGTARSRSCVLKEATVGAEVATSNADGDSDAGVEPETLVASCMAQLGLDDAAAECETLELIAEGGEHLVSGLRLHSVNLSVRASRPTTLTLEDATLDAVFVELQGPITLRVHGARQVDALRAVTSAGGEGQPRLELLQVDATRVQVGRVDAAFEGALRFDQVELQDAQLFADQLVLQSSAVDGGRIEARHLSTTDVQLSSTTLALGDAVLSASKLTGVTFESCDTLALIASTLRASTLVPCTGPSVRVYASNVIASRADGRFESDGSHWEGVAFGATADTELIGFSSGLQSVNFCGAARGPKLGGDVGVTCSSCDGWSGDVTPACRIPGSRESSTGPNYCPLLDVSTFGDCPEPVPERDRPLERPF
jgi:hypothetical protein